MPRVLTATYRLQLHAGFGFDAAAATLPYLRDLGISHVYASPITSAKAGSLHGYDVTDPTRINPELGGDAGFERFQMALGRAEMGLIVDVVPNHMAQSPQNPWWHDVLRHGRNSEFSDFFDIRWNEAAKIELPLLGGVEDLGSLVVLGHGDTATLKLPSGITLPLRPGSTAGGAGADLERLLEQQHYRLTRWQESTGPNYRRFFDINDLVALKVENPQVLNAHHQLIFELVDAGAADGIRVDHPDGLLDPQQYVARLRKRCPDAYLFVEKIVQESEPQPEWPVHGTTGYETLNLLTELWLSPSGLRTMRASYTRYTADLRSFQDVALQSRRDVIEQLLQPELRRATDALRTAIDGHPPDTYVPAVTELAVAFPVYRTYITSTSQQLTLTDRQVLDAAQRQLVPMQGIKQRLVSLCRRL